MTIARTRAAKYSTLLCVVIALAGFSPRAKANDEDPPSRVARLAYAQGSVSFQPAGTDDWVTAGLNRPVTTGDKLWSDNDGRTELQLDGSLVRLSSNTGFSFLNLSDHVTQIQLTAGTLLVRVRRLDENETYEIDTPNLAFSVLRPGVYRITVNEAGDSTAIKIRSGEGEVTGGGAAYTVHANDYDTFSGTDELSANSESYSNDEDQFDTWAANRDRHWENSNSSRYVSAEVVGYEDLDDHGSWRQTPDNGNVWFPRTSVPGWAPYHYGHWDYIEPWGYTWVDDEPWGFAPFHYGRWVSYEGSWGWVPAPAQVEGVVYVRPVYAPALVAWVGGPHFAIGIGVDGGGYAPGESVGWFPLGPREVYVPSYRVSRNYVNNVNVSNTTVNTTVVNNYYNNTVVNKNVNVTSVKYVNQSVPGAVAATTPQAFTSAQPVAKNTVKVDQREVASAPVRAFTPAVVPAKQAVLGTGSAAAKPPVALQTRGVVAKAAPPPPPPSFEKRQEAIKSNGGKPLSVAQIQQIQPVGAHTAAPVRIAPVAAKPVAVVPQTSQTNRPVQPQKSQPQQGNRPIPATNTPQAAAPNATRPPDRPADRPIPPNNGKPAENKPVTPTNVEPANRSINLNNASQPAPGNRPAPTPAVHPNEIPAPPRPVIPPSANPQLDAKHQQEQEQLHAKQQLERQAVQQQQEQDHAKLAQQQADQAKKQQLEQQHQQQTQQLQQKHAEEQKLLQEKQQQERQNPPKPKKDDHPPQAKP
jgi:FecR protein